MRQAVEIDPKQQLAELMDAGPSYPGGIIKELTIPGSIMGGIVDAEDRVVGVVEGGARPSRHQRQQQRPERQQHSVLAASQLWGYSQSKKKK